MKTLFLTASLLMAAAVPALASTGATVAVSVADHGSAVQIASGGTLTLALPTKGGVPYAWKITSGVGPQLTETNKQTVAATPGMAGGSATLTYTFTAGAPGVTTLTAGYYSFSGGDPAQTVSLSVNVIP